MPVTLPFFAYNVDYPCVHMVWRNTYMIHDTAHPRDWHRFEQIIRDDLKTQFPVRTLGNVGVHLPTTHEHDNDHDHNHTQVQLPMPRIDLVFRFHAQDETAVSGKLGLEPLDYVATHTPYPDFIYSFFQLPNPYVKTE